MSSNKPLAEAVAVISAADCTGQYRGAPVVTRTLVPRVGLEPTTP